MLHKTIFTSLVAQELCVSPDVIDAGLRPRRPWQAAGTDDAEGSVGLGGSTGVRRQGRASLREKKEKRGEKERDTHLHVGPEYQHVQLDVSVHLSKAIWPKPLWKTRRELNKWFCEVEGAKYLVL